MVSNLDFVMRQKLPIFPTVQQQQSLCSKLQLTSIRLMRLATIRSRLLITNCMTTTFKKPFLSKVDTFGDKHFGSQVKGKKLFLRHRRKFLIYCVQNACILSLIACRPGIYFSSCTFSLASLKDSSLFRFCWMFSRTMNERSVGGCSNSDVITLQQPNSG